MKLQDILQIYTAHPQIAALAKIIREGMPSTIFAEGLRASSAPLALSALTCRGAFSRPFLIILNDEEEAGYFYHDMEQILGSKQVLFYPSTYRRAVKYAQRDAANEILRTEVLNRLGKIQRTNTGKEEKTILQEGCDDASPLFIVPYLAALSERVTSIIDFQSDTIDIKEGENHDLTNLILRLRELGFRRRDYVYEPGEYAIRGSILDIYSFSSEYPFRIDFFGDEVDSIRTFEVQTQLHIFNYS